MNVFANTHFEEWWFKTFLFLIIRQKRHKKTSPVWELVFLCLKNNKEKKYLKLSIGLKLIHQLVQFLAVLNSLCMA
jgi:hypothetical protein